MFQPNCLYRMIPRNKNGKQLVKALYICMLGLSWNESAFMMMMMVMMMMMMRRRRKVIYFRSISCETSYHKLDFHSPACFQEPTCNGVIWGIVVVTAYIGLDSTTPGFRGRHLNHSDTAHPRLVGIWRSHWDWLTPYWNPFPTGTSADF